MAEKKPTTEGEAAKAAKNFVRHRQPARRASSIEELPQESIRALAKVRMHRRHHHLNALLDD